MNDDERGNNNNNINNIHNKKRDRGVEEQQGGGGEVGSDVFRVHPVWVDDLTVDVSRLSLGTEVSNNSQ